MDQFAPEYSKREKFILMIKLLIGVVSLYLLMQFWLFDWISDYVKIASCEYYGDLNGMQLLLYGLFVASPLTLVVLILVLEGRRSILVLRLGQNPLPGEKVLRRTKYRYGKGARVQPIGLAAILLILIGLAIWGSFQVEKFSRIIPACIEEKLLGLNGKL